MLYILSGQDDYSLHQSLEEIKGSMGDQTMLAANTTVLDGQQLSLAQLRSVCEAAPFLAEKRLVIINRLLERFEAKGKSSRQKKTTNVSDHQKDYKSLADGISHIPDSTVLILIDGGVKSSNPLLKELSPKAEVRAFPLLKGAELRRWIQKYVTREGGSISPQAVDLLIEHIGGNLWIMANEIDKLILFTSRRRIEAEDVKAVVSYVQQANVFAMVDAILEFKAGLAEWCLRQLLAGGATPAYLLVLLSRGVRMIVRAIELRNQGKSGMEIQRKLGLPSEFVLRKTLEQAGRYSLERLKQVYNKLLETDLAIKTGKYEGELALNILIAELCQGHRTGVVSTGAVNLVQERPVTST